jgi:serine/threonine-protein kinase
MADDDQKPESPPASGQEDPEASEDSFVRAAAAAMESSPSEAETGDRGNSRSTRADLTPGGVIGKRYRLDNELGRGGMGVVWAATHLVTRKRVAIKFVRGPADMRSDLRRRFLREARAACAVDHPNTVEVLDVFELEDETPVMVMELLSGETLRELLEREGKLSVPRAASLLLPVTEAVAAAHAAGIVHRDLKPENIFLAGDPGQPVKVKVLDFGIAKLVVDAGGASEAEPITGTGSMVGTPCYMAPEQQLAEKDIDGRADIWALGVILYECLAGVRPVQGSGIGQVVHQLATEGIRPLVAVVPDVMPDAATLVMRMLERKRSDRPQDLREVTGLLSRLLGSTGPTLISGRGSPRGSEREPASQRAVDTESPQAVPRRASRRPWRTSVVVAAGAGTVIAAMAGLSIGRSTRTPVSTPPVAAESTVSPAGTLAMAPQLPVAAPLAPEPQGSGDHPPGAVGPRGPAPALPSASSAAAMKGGRKAAPASAPPAASSASSKAVASPQAEPAPVSTPRPMPGLAEKPPF